MVTKLNLGNGRYLVPVRILPLDGMTAEEAGYVYGTLIPGLKEKYPQCFVDTVKIGCKVYRAVIVEGDHSLYEIYVHEMDAEQKRVTLESRCIIPDGHGGIKHCPLRLLNPKFDPAQEVSRENPKTIKNICEGCPYDTFDKLNYATQSLEGLTRQNDDGTEVPFEISAPMEAEADRYVKARDEVLALIKTKYPEKLAEFALLLDGDNRKHVAETLGKNKSSMYRVGKRLSADLYALFDSLWYLDINK